MQTVKKSLSELVKNDRNVRRHSEKQLNEYVRSIKMFGQIRPIVVDEKNLILAGNGLYEAMIQAGMSDCDCYVVEGLSANQKDKLMLADNKVYELGVTDMQIFDDIIKGLGDDLDVPGYDDDLLKMLNQTLPQIDATVQQYGKIDVTPEQAQKAEQERQDFGMTAQQLQGQPNPYLNVQNPQKAEPQGFSEQATDQQPEYPQERPVERKFIVCPKCGERIWL